jgi:hypothetical protein
MLTYGKGETVKTNTLYSRIILSIAYDILDHFFYIIVRSISSILLVFV